jgi:hypothetical protein
MALIRSQHPSRSTTLTALLVASAACSGTDVDLPLTISTRVTGDTTIVSLSVSVNEITGRAHETEMATLAWQVGGGDDAPFFRIADTRFAPGDEVVVADGGNYTIIIFDADGSPVRRMGREGRGPGEFKGIRAVVPVGTGLVVWQVNSLPVFTAFSAAGGVLATAPPPMPGDWNQINFRQPSIYDLRQSGPEDVPMRLRRESDSTFLHVIGITEDPDSSRYDSLPMFLTRYTVELTLVDTVARLNGPPATRGTAPPSFIPPFIWPAFAATPLWTNGNGWIAFGDHSEGRITVEHHDGRIVRIEWPHNIEPVTDADRLHFANWDLEDSQLQDSDFAERIREMPRSEVEEMMNQYAKEMPPEWLPERRPAATAMFGAGSCLFVAGFNADDSRDGRSRTWIVLDVAEPTYLGTIQIPARGVRVRDFSTGAALVTAMDEYGDWLLEKYTFSTCAR